MNPVKFKFDCSSCKKQCSPSSTCAEWKKAFVAEWDETCAYIRKRLGAEQ